MPANDIGIDLGTTNSLVYSTGRGLVLSEPSVVVYDKDTEKIKAIGEEARQMAGHVTSNMEVICPIRQGMIIDFVVMEKMLKYFIAKAMGRRAFRKPRISVCVPSGITEIERKAVEEATYQAELQEKEYTATAGGGVVSATVDGKHTLKALTIDPEAVDPEDVEMLQDMVIAAVNEAVRAAMEDMSSSMGKITGGMNLPF